LQSDEKKRRTGKNGDKQWCEMMNSTAQLSLIGLLEFDGSKGFG